MSETDTSKPTVSPGQLRRWYNDGDAVVLGLYRNEAGTTPGQLSVLVLHTYEGYVAWDTLDDVIEGPFADEKSAHSAARKLARGEE